MPQVTTGNRPEPHVEPADTRTTAERGIHVELDVDGASLPRASRPFDFERWYNDYSGLVRGMISRVIKDPDIRDDIAQTVWSRIARVGYRYDSNRAKETTFIGLIARQAVADYLEREVRRKTVAPTTSFDLSDESDPRHPDVPGVEDSQLAHAINREDRARILERLAELEPRQRRLIEARFGHNTPLAQLAEELQIPLGTVKSLLWRAIRNLRRSTGDSE